MKWRARLLIPVAALVVGSGCVSQISPFKAYADGWIGRPISEYQAAVLRSSKTYASTVGWSEKWETLPNGNRAYVYPERRDCFVHWEVNDRGIIIGYRPVGDRC